jgi:hypothetical protein
MRSNKKGFSLEKRKHQCSLYYLVFQAQQLRQASPDKSAPELRMRVGPLPPTPGQSAPHWSHSPGGTDPSSSSSPPVAPPRVESLAFMAAGTGDAAAAPPLPARNFDPAPAPPPRNLPGGLPPPPPPAKLPRPVSHESLNNVPTGGGGHQRRGSHAAALPPTSPLFRGGGGEQVSPPADSGGGARHVSHARTRSSPVSLEQTLGT